MIDIKIVYISENAYPKTVKYIASLGRKAEIITARKNVYPEISAHPDIFMCRLPDKIVFAPQNKPGYSYPECAAYNAVCLGDYFIHNLRCTAPELLEEAETAGLKPVNVNQGYTRCSTVIVDRNSAVTSDKGIAKVLSGLAGISVLYISEGFIKLPGFSSGFLGGCSGIIEETLIFNGDLGTHPDHSHICAFAAERGVKIRHFPGLPLTDIGSMIEEP